MGAFKPAKQPSRTMTTTSFGTLEPRIKNISQSTIRKRWRPLPTSTQDKIRQMVLNVQSKRSGGTGRIPSVTKAKAKARKPTAAAPTTTTTSSTRAQQAAEAEEEYSRVVREVADKLVSRLPRMPFPGVGARATSARGSSGSVANASDDTFDLSRTLQRVAGLQAQLTMNTQSAALLRRQIKREQAALRRDRAELAALTAGLKSSRAVRRKQERGLHPLARGLPSRQQQQELEGLDAAQAQQEEEAERERVAAVAGIVASGRLENNHYSLDFRFGTRTGNEDHGGHGDETNDDDNESESESGATGPHRLDELLVQLRSHLSSMRNNVAGMRPVLSAMDDTSTGIDRFVASGGGAPTPPPLENRLVERQAYAGLR